MSNLALIGRFIIIFSKTRLSSVSYGTIERNVIKVPCEVQFCEYSVFARLKLGEGLGIIFDLSLLKHTKTARI